MVYNRVHVEQLKNKYKQPDDKVKSTFFNRLIPILFFLVLFFDMLTTYIGINLGLDEGNPLGLGNVFLLNILGMCLALIFIISYWNKKIDKFYFLVLVIMILWRIIIILSNIVNIIRVI